MHLAALAGVRPSLERPAEYADVNVRGTRGAARSGRARGRAARGIRVLVVGLRRAVSDGPFRESDPVERPVSPYAATKRAGELLAHTFHHAFGLSVTCARIFTAYGPRQRPDLAIRKFAERLLAGKAVPVFGDGSAQRDFTYVDDLVEGLVRAIDRDLGFALLNFAGGRTVTVLEVVSALERELGVDGRDRLAARADRRRAPHLGRHLGGARGARLRAGDRLRRRCCGGWRRGCGSERKSRAVSRRRAKAIGKEDHS